MRRAACSRTGSRKTRITCVLLIEAGGSHRHPFITMPKGIFKIMASPVHMWPYMTQPDTASKHAAESWARGRTLGGSSSVNGMVYVRGQDADYDSLAADSKARIGAGSTSVPLIARWRITSLGRRRHAATSGPLHITLPEMRHAAHRCSHPRPARPWVSRPRPTLTIQRTCLALATRHAPSIAGVVQSGATAFLDPIRAKEFNGDHRTLPWMPSSSMANEHRPFAPFTMARRFGSKARREYLVVAARCATPAVLQRSGVGPAELLRRRGVPMVQDSPEVGRNVIEHRGLVMQWRVPDHSSVNRSCRVGVDIARPLTTI